LHARVIGNVDSKISLPHLLQRNRKTCKAGLGIAFLSGNYFLRVASQPAILIGHCSHFDFFAVTGF